MATGRMSNGGISTTLRNIISIISILAAFAVAVGAVQSRASKAEVDVVACEVGDVEKRVSAVEWENKYWEKRFNDFEKKLDKVLEGK